MIHEVLLSDKWYVYAAFVTGAFILGALIDAFGKALRARWQLATADAKETEIQNLPLSQVLKLALFFEPDMDILSKGELKANIDRMMSLVAQAPRGHPFRAQDRTLAMMTNIGIALVFLAVFWLPHLCFQSGLGWSILLLPSLL